MELFDKRKYHSIEVDSEYHAGHEQMSFAPLYERARELVNEKMMPWRFDDGKYEQEDWKSHPWGYKDSRCPDDHSSFFLGDPLREEVTHYFWQMRRCPERHRAILDLLKTTDCYDSMIGLWKGELGMTSFPCLQTMFNRVWCNIAVTYTSCYNIRMMRYYRKEGYIRRKLLLLAFNKGSAKTVPKDNMMQIVSYFPYHYWGHIPESFWGEGLPMDDYGGDGLSVSDDYDTEDDDTEEVDDDGNSIQVTSEEYSD
jgi:hypothetical protein